jgi:hypothetical protein
MPTSNELIRVARACAERLTYTTRPRNFPSFGEIEEQCGDDYEDLLLLLHEDEVFRSANVEEQETLVKAIREALPEAVKSLVDQLVDNLSAQLWLQQEGAFHLGMAVGLRLAEAGLRVPDEDEENDEERREREDAIRFGRHHGDSRFAYTDDDEEEDADEEEDDDEDPRRRH